MVSPFVHQLLEATAAAAAPVLATLLIAIASRVFQKLGLNLSAQHEARLRYFATRATQIVEETIEAKGPVKLTAAVGMLEQKYPKLPIAALEDVVHAALAEQRADVTNETFQPK